ncbi:MAG: hypothetical protein ACI88L_000275 [Candidatus Paceibacteria bacterium]|jgi:hypothetical protein
MSLEDPKPQIDPNEGVKKGPIQKTEQEILNDLKENLGEAAFIEVGSLVEDEARDAGQAELTREKEAVRGWSPRKIWNRVVTHNLLREYNEFKAISRIKKEIIESENIYNEESEEKEHHEMAMTAITERFLSEYEGVIREDSGEKKKTLEDSEEGAEEIKTGIKKLVLDYASGAINDEAYAEERTKLLSKITGASKDTVGDGVMYADNLKEMVQQVKQAMDHGISIEKIDQYLDPSVVIGKAESGVKTEARTNKLQNLTEKIHKTLPGALVGNGTFIAAAVFGVDALVSKATQTSARILGKSVGFFGGAAVAGGIAAYKENRRIKKERSQHSRDRAKGKAFGTEEETPRRAEMEKSMYETKQATELTDELLSEVYIDGNPEKGVKDFETKEDLDKAMAAIADIESRINLNNKEKIDLIAYSNTLNVEMERTDMEIGQMRAKHYLKEKIENTPELQAFLGDKDFKEAIKTKAEINERLLTDEEIKVKDKEFSSIKRRAVGKAFLKGAVTAAVIGTVIQEIGAFFSDNMDGAVETMFKGASAEAKATTMLRGFYEHAAGESGLSASELSAGAVFEESFVDGHTLNFPEGIDVTDHGDGTFSLLNDGKTLADHISLEYNADGTMAESTKQALEDAGIMHAGHSATTVMESSEVTVTPKEFLEAKKDGVINIARDLWYDNDTEAPIFDKNELRTWWGGENNTGIDSDGNYVFNIAQMTEDGSSHGDFSADAEELVKKGGVKMLLSMSRDTQNMVFEVDIDVNGNAVIDPNSEIGKIFFSEEGGKAVFQGRFAEVAQMMGVEDGAEHVRILSTVEGNGLDGFTATEETAVEEISDKFVPDMARDWEWPPVLPLYGRVPLEPVKNTGEGKIRKKELDDIKLIEEEDIVERKYRTKNDISASKHLRGIGKTDDGVGGPGFGQHFGTGSGAEQGHDNERDLVRKHENELMHKAKQEERANKLEKAEENIKGVENLNTEIRKNLKDFYENPGAGLAGDPMGAKKAFQAFYNMEIAKLGEEKQNLVKIKEERLLNDSERADFEGIDSVKETLKKEVYQPSLLLFDEQLDLVQKSKEEAFEENKARDEEAKLEAEKPKENLESKFKELMKEGETLRISVEGKNPKIFNIVEVKSFDGEIKSIKAKNEGLELRYNVSYEDGKVILSPRNKAKPFNVVNIEKYNASEEEIKVVSSKVPGSIETAPEDISVEKLLDKNVSEIKSDEWELLGKMQKDFEKKASAEDVEKLQKEYENINLLTIDSILNPVSVSKLETMYAKILFLKEKKKNPDMLDVVNLRAAQDKIKDFITKKTGKKIPEKAA